MQASLRWWFFSPLKTVEWYSSEGVTYKWLAHGATSSAVLILFKTLSDKPWSIYPWRCHCLVTFPHLPKGTCLFHVIISILFISVILWVSTHRYVNICDAIIWMQPRRDTHHWFSQVCPGRQMCMAELTTGEDSVSMLSEGQRGESSKETDSRCTFPRDREKVGTKNDVS